MKEIKIPDVKIDMNGINLQFEHGNFFRKFKVPSSLDCICTSFFVDVVPDIVHLVKYCKMLLKPSGIWINNGPLYYHNTSKNALHLTDDQLLLLLEEDFTILEHSLNSYKYTKIDSVNSVEFNRCLWFVVTPKNINNV
ncbi:hypothetical protein PPL_04740 [Heterostelium album PN500]|uniref:carnosine N-methyltransferase n=1 Tax=Heterostelium pallidum (strain ATCC 26659 / Pp 5 / PN500) TaxID=670386 RepID=D3B8E7_HETP5|nr:hypothetical protein PPL_04740 [Heterostelium album PN500]EFA82315.1 hypothetical protein PPL_04740 [Heterostelium album PN500]|eukprot:XP_020434432.1 hypothetical protein PPL_04740 [Heterostelium album PN500]